ncbi:MAG: hypothetical protein MST10_10120, partial [Lentisphaeria bacterium]|nr:hypothetical protein [Lentisphaeria bacterium]
LNLLDMTSVLNTHDYELMANNPQDISSDFLFVIKSNNEKEQKKQEAFGWLKKDNYIIFSALAQLQNIKQNIDFTLSLEFENNEDVLKDIKLVVGYKDFLYDFNGDFLFDAKISVVEGKRTYYINFGGEFRVVKIVDLEKKIAIDNLNNELFFINGKWQKDKN